MNTALFLTCTLWAPLLRWSRGRFGRTTTSGTPASRAGVSSSGVSSGASPVMEAGMRQALQAGMRPVLQQGMRPVLQAGGMRPVAPRPSMACARPLRVVRVLDAGQPRSQAGRLVISGRMADVCAELDRLAALEAAHA